MTDKIEYFFSIGSPWAYVGLDAFTAVAERAGLAVEPHLIPLIEENGGIYSRNRPPARRSYWVEDLKRWAHLRGVTLRMEDRAALSDPSPAAALVVAAWLDGGNWLALARSLQEAFWSRGEDIGRSGVNRAIAAAAGFDASALTARSEAADVRERLEYSRNLAARSGIFGVPTYRHGETLFWGQDSLPFLERHLRGERLTA